VVVAVMPVAVPVPAAVMMMVMMPVAGAQLAIVHSLVVGFGGRVRRDRLGCRGFGSLQHRGGLRCGCRGGDRAGSGREAKSQFQEFTSLHRSNLSL